MICAICWSCAARPLLAGKTVLSGVIDCTASDEGFGVGIGVGGDGVVGLNQSDAGAEAEQSLGGGLLRGALGRALGTLPRAEVAGLTETGVLLAAVAEESVPATEVIMGMVASGL